jgi:hypothetical protein
VTVKRTALLGGVGIIVVAVTLLSYVARPSRFDSARTDTVVPLARPDAAVTYTANRASTELLRRGLTPSLPSEHETWTGSYAGQMAIAGGVEGTVGAHFDITQRSGHVVHVSQPGMFEVDLACAPDQPNMAAATGSYSIPVAPYRVEFEIAAAIRAGRLQIAIVTADSALPDHPEIAVPGSRMVGELQRTTP